MSDTPQQPTPSAVDPRDEEVPQRKREIAVSVGGLGPLATLSKYQNYIIAAVVIAAIGGGCYWYYKNKWCISPTASSSEAKSKSSVASKTSSRHSSRHSSRAEK